MYTLTVAFVAIACTIFVVILARNLSSSERALDYRLQSLAIDDPTFERCMAHLLGPPLVGGNRLTCLINGREIFPAMLDAVRGATKTITFETYIYWSGTIGREFSQVLAERARAGIRVHVLLDWVGSGKLDTAALQEMQEAGVQVEKYRPLHWYSLSRMNSRTHRKILVVDGRTGFIGGVGIADQWLGDAESPAHWRDTHFQVDGPVVAHLQAAFMDNWMKTRADVLNHDDYFPHLEDAGSVLAQVFKSSPREGSDSARLMFLMSIAAARESILIANSYFVPDNRLLKALISARKRNVRVEIIVPGPHIDTSVTRRASRSLWGPLLEAGVAIYEYQRTMFHCKVMVVDNRWLSVGSTNFDNRSFRLNDEANLNALDKDLANEQAQEFERDKQNSRRISLQEWNSRPLHEKAIESTARLFRSQV